MKSKTILQFLVAIGLIVFVQIDLSAASLTIAPNVPVENPPQVIAKKKPRAQDFNALLRDFLQTDAVDVKKSTIDPKLTALYSSETSNALYRRLKIREKTYGGSLYVCPVASEGEQIIVISARILHESFGDKTLFSEYIHIVFSPDGAFKTVRKGVSTQQEL